MVEYAYDKANRPVSMRRGGSTYYYVYNARGDIAAVVNSSGAVVNTYSYNPWGKILSVSEQVENSFRYASYRYDTETGLYYLQNRYYNPDLMRFITRDAIRDQIGNPFTSNYYQYADGNPIMNIDSDGNLPLLWLLVVAAYWAFVAFNFYVRYPEQTEWVLRRGYKLVRRYSYRWILAPRAPRCRKCH